MTYVNGPLTSGALAPVYTFGKRKYELSSRSYVMGVLNVTPDSFSDGGRYLSPERAVEHALRMIDEGADFIDIGGESTRPKGTAYGEGADPVRASDELRRIMPVIERLAGMTDVPISVDTSKAEVAREALDAGAVIVNDISGFRFDPDLPSTVASAGASAILMHSRGTPKTMQELPAHQDLLAEVRAQLRAALRLGERAGIRQMMVDPGIGFSKTVEENLRLLVSLGELQELGYPVLVGPSRKSFIGEVLGLPVEERLEGTLSSVAIALFRGAHIVRVHDVKESVRTARMVDALKAAEALRT